jgi:hypothetical protein
MFDVGRSMFDVQSVRCCGQAEFHTNPAAYEISLISTGFTGLTGFLLI